MDEKMVLPGASKMQMEYIRKFRLMDDTFMTKVFEDKECSELLLRVILERDDLTVVRSDTQHEIKNLYGRSSRLDIVALDVKGRKFNIEIQRDDDGADPRRARYYGGMMDTNSLMPGQKINELSETYIVFITEHDFFDGGKPIYTIERTIAEMNGALFNDGLHIIYVNSEIQDNTRLGRLMQDMYCTDPHKMNYEVLSNRTKYFKESEEGVRAMCKLMEEYSSAREKIAEAKGREEGREEGAKKIAINLWASGIKDLEKIASLTNLSVDEVRKLFEGKSA